MKRMWKAGAKVGAKCEKNVESRWKAGAKLVQKLVQSWCKVGAKAGGTANGGGQAPTARPPRPALPGAPREARLHQHPPPLRPRHPNSASSANEGQHKTNKNHQEPAPWNCLSREAENEMMRETWCTPAVAALSSARAGFQPSSNHSRSAPCHHT